METRNIFYFFSTTGFCFIPHSKHQQYPAWFSHGKICKWSCEAVQKKTDWKSVWPRDLSTTHRKEPGWFCFLINRTDNVKDWTNYTIKNLQALMFNNYIFLLIKGLNPKSNCKSCSCGKNIVRGEKTSCVKDSKGQTRCPCVVAGHSCTRDCRCKGCKNCSAELDISTVSVTSIPEHVSNVSCKCGQNKSKELAEFVACKDGIRKSKCPCWRVAQTCGFKCKCINCGNPNGIRMRRCDENMNKIQQKRKRARRRAEYLASQDILPVTMDHVRDVFIIQRILASRRNHSAAIARKYNWFV